MPVGAQVAPLAALMGDHARADMLTLMMDGRAHTPTELSAAAEVSPATASGHLAKLLSHGVIAVPSQGRHRYYRLGSADIARLLETLMVASSRTGAAVALRRRIPAELCEARTCYDHLAGRLGVAIADSLLSRGAIAFGDGTIAITPAGSAVLQRLQIDLSGTAAGSRRPLCRPCLDWSERRAHLGGALGRALLQRLLAQEWITRSSDSRAVLVTPAGRAVLARLFDYQSRQ